MADIAEIKRRLEEAAPSIAAPAADDTALSPQAPPRPAPTPDPFTAALIDIARHYGRPTSANLLISGLPLTDGRLPLEHIEHAAARAGLDAELSQVDLARLSDAELPLIVLIGDAGPDIVWSLLRDDKSKVGGKVTGAVMSQPGKAHIKAEMPLAELAKTRGLTAIRLKPAAENDGRGSDLKSGRAENWMLPAFKASRRIYSEAIAATFAVNLLALAMPLFMMNVYDRVLPNAAIDTLWALASGVLLATLFDFTIKVLRARFVDAASRRADVTLANFVCGRLLGARLSAAPISAGVRANTLREFESLREFFNSATLTTFGDLPFVFLFIGMIAAIAGPLALIPLAGIPILLGIAWITQLKLGRLTENAFREAGQKSAVAVEMLVGLESIKSARGESWAARNWEKSVAEHIRSSNEIRHLSNLGQQMIQAAQSVVQIVMIIVGFYMLMAGALTMGALIASTMLAGRAVQPLGQMAGLISRIYQVRVAYRSLSEIVAAPQERPAGVKLLDKTSFDGAITFENVSFRYEADAAPALDQLSFQIKPGERVAIIGGIGTGKSTALRLIHGLQQPADGRVLVDGIPVEQIDPSALRANIGLALQNADLFHGTIRSNIALANPAASDAEIIAAATAASALDWIARMPKGFETPVRERGAGLSGGQRQSVVLARTLLAAPRILLLDEPTSDMDPRSEQLIVERLAQTLAKRTLIVVTHRPAMLELVDRIIVLEAGRKLLDGPKASVLKSLQMRAGGQQAAAAQTAAPATKTASATTLKVERSA